MAWCGPDPHRLTITKQQTNPSIVPPSPSRFANSGLDWSRLKALPAPYQPEGSAVLQGLVGDLRGVERADARYPALIQQLTANFDDFPEQVGRSALCLSVSLSVCLCVCDSACLCVCDSACLGVCG